VRFLYLIYGLLVLLGTTFYNLSASSGATGGWASGYTSGQGGWSSGAGHK